MDLHISVIADFKTACPDVEVVDWCLSSHAWVMGRCQDTPKHIHAGNWMSLNEGMIRAFQREYDGFLSQFDGFITGHVTAFAMIYERYNKPILAINSCRYDMPFCWSKNMRMLETYTNALRRMYARGQIRIVSNNRGDQDYTYLGTGIHPDYNPSLCLYTNMRYLPTKTSFLCYTGSLPEHPLVTPRPPKYEWSDIATYKGVIHFPYETSLMSMFEHFTAGCPMFFPSKQYWKTHPILHSVSKYWGHAPRYLATTESPEFWIERSDVYTVFQSPNTRYFDSISHLFELLESFVYVDDTDARAKHVASVRTKWHTLLDSLRIYSK
jgi:hypothetical protein